MRPVDAMRTKLIRPRHGRESYTEWRKRCLRENGFEHETANWLASAKAFDIHALLGLVERGCPPALAVRIVAPLEWDGRWAWSDRELAAVSTSPPTRSQEPVR
jgi:hypothetical protein